MFFIIDALPQSYFASQVKNFIRAGQNQFLRAFFI